jgi:DNA-binding NarL/FixJ family response regulator
MSLQQAVDDALEPRPDTSAGQAAPERRSVAPGQPDLLTAREREVVALVAGGLANLQIAEQLVISERTVEAHVSHALAKLGLDSRVRLATWAVEHRLPASGSQ